MAVAPRTIQSDESRNSHKTLSFPIVGVGASAGGLEAFTQLLRSLPEKAAMAFVLVQHLDPTHKSSLVELLSRAAKLPVEEIEDGVTIQPNVIYVNPENVEVTIENGMLHLHPRAESSQPSLPINRFFISLAEDQQNRAIGVVLSGAAHDGTLGLQAIRSVGGITFAQDKTASVQGMPESAIQADVVDFVLPPDEIAGILVRIGDKSIGRLESIEEVGDPGLHTILALVRDRVGVDMAPYKTPTLNRRIHRRLLVLNLSSLSGYAKYLEDNPAEIDALYQDMLINVSHMFRDKATLELLESKVLPALAAKGTAKQPMRMWVAGCASGEEAYSLAIICREFLDRWSLSISVQIFATDLSARMIAQARSGLYTPSALTGVSEQRLERFFTREGDNRRVVQDIREMCVFAQHNLLVDPPFSQMDLISCCNVLIYFKPTSQQKLINAFHYALKPGGFLILSPSETVGTSRALFSLLDKSHKVYIRKTPSSVSYLSPGSNFAPRPTFNVAKPMGRVEDESDVGKLADNLLLARFTPGSVVIDNDMEIVQFRGATSMYLEPSPGKASLNIFKMARPGLGIHLRKAIREVKKDKQPFQCDVVIKHDKGPRSITLEVLPLIATATTEPYFLVVFAENSSDTLHTDTSLVSQPQSKPPKFDAKDRQILQLDLELTEAQNELRRISEDHEAIVQELQLSNEEIRSANEELQTLNEELETTSEELASSNEELTTTNQALRDSNGRLKSSRDFAEAIIQTVRESLIVLSSDLQVRIANESFYRTFSVTAEMTEGKYIYDLGDGQWRIPQLQSLLEDILPKNSHFEDYIVEHTFPNIGPKKMLLDARRIPTKDGEGEYMVLLAIEDITEQKQSNTGKSIRRQ
jgi:two-component system, chemotaxis family, CheB/CheR fusion protein